MLLLLAPIKVRLVFVGMLVNVDAHRFFARHDGERAHERGERILVGTRHGLLDLLEGDAAFHEACERAQQHARTQVVVREQALPGCLRVLEVVGKLHVMHCGTSYNTLTICSTHL